MDSQGKAPEKKEEDIKLFYMSDYIKMGSFIPCVMGFVTSASIFLLYWLGFLTAASWTLFPGSKSFFIAGEKTASFLLQNFCPLSVNAIDDDLTEVVVDKEEGGYGAAEFFNHKEFNVNLAENWENLEMNQSKLNEIVRSRDPEKGRVNLHAGKYVAAACFAGEIHRVKLLEEIRRKTSAEDGLWKVHLIDYGNRIQVSQKDIQRLPTQFFGSMKAQAVNCTLALPKEFSFPAESYRDVNTIFLEEIKDHTLGIYFHEYLEEVENRKWSVSVSVFKKQRDKNGKERDELNLNEEFSTKIPDIASHIYKCIPAPRQLSF